MLFILSWIASACELYSSWLVGNKNRFGFLINIIGCIFWIIVAVFDLPAQGLLLVVVPALFINTRNFLKWKK
jgi:hypothetical protein